MVRISRCHILFSASFVCLAGPVTAQDAPYTATLLPAVRRAASLIPGDPPEAIHVVSLNPFKGPVAAMVEGGGSDTVAAAYPVFQIRFARGWVMVDAALDRDFVPRSSTFSDEQYASIQEALRDARLVVVTHEHHDHVAGVLRSPYLAEIQQHTVLTRPQVETLLVHPNNPRIKLDSASAAQYLVLDYEPYLPIAPGIVLIKAAGHSPGSQMVYVRLASGSEIILVGDVAWHTSGITVQRQKPEASTRSFGGEDRAAISEQLRWLHGLSESQVVLVVSHDQEAISRLIARGVLREGFNVRNP